ncbi:MAG: hypothetical protein JRH20_14000 [Deltaproteobacteria bacterium]|nr:hypothetical protein [Deltaproteobacteria bacterium]
MNTTTSPKVLIALASCMLLLQPSCSDGDGDSNDACLQLLDCCESLSPMLQSQCQDTYDQWHQASDADAQCKRALEMMGDQCSAANPPTGTYPPSVDNDGWFSDDVENTNALCSDGQDNNENGYTDCEDWSCSRSMNVTICDSPITAEENTNALCSDGEDNDRNGYLDCKDFGCSRNPYVTVCGIENTNTLCSDGEDNDHNGYIDCKDFGCSRNPMVTVCGAMGVTPDVNRTTCTGWASANGSLAGAAPLINAGAIYADNSGDLLLTVHQEPLLEGSLLIALALPTFNGKVPCALMRLRNNDWDVVDTSQLCEVLFSSLEPASSLGTCDGTVLGSYLGVFLGEVVSGSFHLPTDVPVQGW